MKNALLIALLLPVSALAFNSRVGESDIQKSLDGRAVLCVSASDLGRVGFGARNLQVVGRGENLQVDVALPFVKCVQSGDKFVWEETALTSPMDSKDIFGNPIRIYQDDREFVLVNSGYKQIGNTPEGRDGSAASFTFPLSQNMSSADRDNLGRGLQVGASIQVFSRSTLSIEQNGVKTLYGRVSGGAYTIRFVLFRDGDGQLKVDQLSMN